MTHGSVRNWLKAPGDHVAEFDVVMEVDTESLTEEAYRVGSFSGTVTLLVEAQEDGVLQRILVPEGQHVAIGTPVALMSEEEVAPPGLQEWRPPEGFSVYAAGAAAGADVPRTLVWQSYLKEGGKDSGGCS
ncbi:hypothetical protein WJX81_001745 [Elliptochloris bilobata]|uniref:Lipoyl-binding domain-containing protein n=1 Tax=Elliptochloris bilobata TaxID=381761 RepID=A0AAW1QDF1_9CHLO